MPSRVDASLAMDEGSREQLGRLLHEGRGEADTGAAGWPPGWSLPRLQQTKGATEVATREETDVGQHDFRLRCAVAGDLCLQMVHLPCSFCRRRVLLVFASVVVLFSVAPTASFHGSASAPSPRLLHQQQQQQRPTDQQRALPQYRAIVTFHARRDVDRHLAYLSDCSAACDGARPLHHLGLRLVKLQHQPSPDIVDNLPLTDFVVFTDDSGGSNDSLVALLESALWGPWPESRQLCCPLVKRIGPDRVYAARGLRQRPLSTDERQDSWWRRKLFSPFVSGGQSAVRQTGADKLHALGYRGHNAVVAVFDSGIAAAVQGHFLMVEDCTNWTDDGRSLESCEDTIGHGTFVASIIASTASACPGISPEARLYIFKVFTDKFESYTSWILGALDHAVHAYAPEDRIDILNLSVGGPDALDQPFVDKIAEAVAAGITIVAAAGNDGPDWGTVNHPASDVETIAVGASTSARGTVSAFSSRGPTTLELGGMGGGGMGRPKPDILAPGTHVAGLHLDGQSCRTMSGSSVAAPVVSASLALLFGAVAPHAKRSVLTPGAARHLLMSTASSDPSAVGTASIWERGAGLLDIQAAMIALSKYDSPPLIVAFPQDLVLDGDRAKDFGPLNLLLPLYPSAQPFIFNFTLISPRFRSLECSPSDIRIVTGGALNRLVRYAVDCSRHIWPYHGWLSLRLWLETPNEDTPSDLLSNHPFLEGHIAVSVRIPLRDATAVGWHSPATETLVIPLKLPLIPTPPRSRRILFDMHHSAHFPFAFYPRDDLAVSEDLLDWHGDHPISNFRHLVSHLRLQAGFHVEILNDPLSVLNCSSVVADDYLAILLVDPETAFSRRERSVLVDLVRRRGLSVVVLAEWFSKDIQDSLQFADTGTKKIWSAQTCGSNVPSLNFLLEPFGIVLGTARVLNAQLRYLDRHSATERVVGLRSMTEIVRFPGYGALVFDDGTAQEITAADVRRHDLAHIEGVSEPVGEFAAPALLGLWLGISGAEEDDSAVAGRISVLVDSSCADSSHRSFDLFGDCFQIVESMLQFSLTGTVQDIAFPHVFSTGRGGWTADRATAATRFPADEDPGEGDGRQTVDKTCPPWLTAGRTPMPARQSLADIALNESLRGTGLAGDIDLAIVATYDPAAYAMSGFWRQLLGWLGVAVVCGGGGYVAGLVILRCTAPFSARWLQRLRELMIWRRREAMPW